MTNHLLRQGGERKVRRMSEKEFEKIVDRVMAKLYKESLAKRQRVVKGAG